MQMYLRATSAFNWKSLYEKTKDLTVVSYDASI